MDIALNQDMSFITLILQASWVVKGVLLLLLFASVASWWLIFEKIFTLHRERLQAEAFEREFWGGSHSKSPSAPMKRDAAAVWKKCFVPAGANSAANAS
jgi:biopolymer transport protein ExbB/TolQ